MRTELEQVADAADEVADDQRQVARRARTMQRRRDHGALWTTILEKDRAPGLLEMARGSARRVGETTSKLSRTFARGLASEGASHRQIARRLSVTHQRVTAILRSEPEHHGER